jgi:hypothetical protein
MADEFLITPYKVRAAGTDVPPEEVQAGINSLAQQTTIALNTLSTQAQVPSGPAGGDLSGTYPNPTVSAVHVTSGTMSGVAITTGSVNNTPIGATTPNTVAATSVFASGGAVPAVTTTGTQVWNSPNPTVQFIDSIRSAGNKNAFITWGSTVLAFGFANDAFTSFTNALTITGGQVSGVSGITSTSGSGVWAHTGSFSASGSITTTSGNFLGPGAGYTIGNTTGLSSGGAIQIFDATHGSNISALIGGSQVANFTSTGINNAAIGATTPSTGAFTTLTASTAIGVASGGTGRATLTAHSVLVGEGTAAIAQIVPSTAGQALISAGAAADPVFGFTTGALLNIQYLTATSGTYAATAGTNSIVLIMVAPGGGGGGTPATGAGQSSAGGGGASGGWIQKRQTTGFNGATYAIPAGGAGGVAPANGTAGGNTTWSNGSLTVAGGGGGVSGVAQTLGIIAYGSPGALSASGDLNIPGVPGELGFVLNGAGVVAAGNGASGTWGKGGLGGVGGTATGGAGTGYGAGGSGASAGASTAAQTGGAGAPGIIIVYEYA